MVVAYRLSPDELKALVLFYGSYEKARKRLGIGKASLVDAANADIKGKAYRLSQKSYSQIHKVTQRLSESSKKKIRQWEKLLESTSDHPNVKRAFMNAKQSERETVFNLRQKRQYAKIKESIFWSKSMSKLYDKNAWKAGQWKSKK